MRFETILTVERNAGRVGEILGVMAKYGLADWLRGLDYHWLQSKFRSLDGQRIAELPTPTRIRLALTELGTTFIKLGQMLSTRPDLVGAELAEELSKLQAEVPSDKPEVVRETFVAELKGQPEDIFARFDPEPFASASIAQVHRARLKTGEDVVVKIQHAGVEDRVVRDLEILAGLADLAEKHAPFLRPYRPVSTVRQFRRITLRELDFTHEMRHLELFVRHFPRDTTIHFPGVFEPYCSRRVLTMERLEGIPVSDVERLRGSGQDLPQFARRIANMYLNMIFRDGFYHADPHPGNLMLLEGGAIGVLDCGMVGRIDENLRTEIETMLLTVAENDADQLCDIVLRIGSVPPSCNREDLATDIGDFLADYVGVSLKQFDLSGALRNLVEIIRRHHITLPTGINLLIKVLAMLEGTSRRLDPDFSLAELLEPFYSNVLRRRMSPRRIFHRLQRNVRDWERLLSALPRDLNEVLTRVRAGTFHVKLEHEAVQTTVNRLVVGVITASLYVGASLLWALRAPPVLLDVSVVGALGYLMAVYLTIRLLLAIRRSGDLSQKRQR